MMDDDSGENGNDELTLQNELNVNETDYEEADEMSRKADSGDRATRARHSTRRGQPNPTRILTS